MKRFITISKKDHCFWLDKEKVVHLDIENGSFYYMTGNGHLVYCPTGSLDIMICGEYVETKNSFFGMVEEPVYYI